MSHKKVLLTNETKNIAGCYAVIHDFFDSFPVHSSRKYITTAIKAACKSGIWKKSAPGDLLFFIDRLKTLIPAVYTIIESDSIRKKAILPNANTPFPDNYPFYAIDSINDSLWLCFPRSLCAKEFNNPYKALAKFTKWTDKKQWLQHLDTLLSFALGIGSLTDAGIDLEILRLCELLLKMIEASYWIDLRLNTHINSKHIYKLL